MKRTKNSHIIIPRFILRYYENNRQSIWQMNTQTFQIKLARAASLNTQKGYYSDITEEYLSRHFEAPFAKVVKPLIGWDFSNTYDIPPDFSDLAKRFIVMIMLREPQMYARMRSKSILLQLVDVPKEDEPDWAVHSLQLNSNVTPLDDYVVVCAKPQGDSSFVLPMCGLYEAKLFSHSSMFFPISPSLSLLLLHIDDAHEIVQGKTAKVLSISENNVALLNLLALKAEIQTTHPSSLGSSWVIANNRATLEQLAKDYEAMQVKRVP